VEHSSRSADRAAADARTKVSGVSAQLCGNEALLDRNESAKSAVFGGNSTYRSGAPRSMKMGNIVSPWRYDGRAALSDLPTCEST
jgi:hypothetical protein